MTQFKKPYLVIPHFVEQPTWGGTYIADYKGWSELSSVSGKNIGQSFELAGKSMLTDSVSDSGSEDFTPEGKFISVIPKGAVNLSDLVRQNGTDIVGPYVYEKWHAMPILIKFTQAKGNSFQLHAKPSQANARWSPKAESWYFLEKGIMTFGIKAETSVTEYKACCLAIESKMKELSAKVVSKATTLEEAKKQAKIFIAAQNPWAYVNVHEVEKYGLVDLSGGGLHHSWEDRPDITPNGNIVYEVQQDVEDDKCTLRSFDQGKFKDDGTIRPITIDDYFSFLDPDPERNNVKNAIVTPKGTKLLKTVNYSMDLFELQKPITDSIVDSFVHLFVRDGKAVVNTANGSVTIHKGHSAFVPFAAGKYEIIPQTPDVSVIKTYIEK